MTEQDLEIRLQLLEQTVGFLKARVDTEDAHSTKMLPTNARRNARSMAMDSILIELAIHAGISEQQLQEHFEARTRHYLDLALQRSRDIGANLAGRSDDRDQDEIPTESGFPPLFP